MKKISATDLIHNSDGSVYHLGLRPEQLADIVLTVGDPERVPKVSKYFDGIEYAVNKREFVTHTGYIDDKRLTVISTGMGTDNIEILMNELDALVNIDLGNRVLNDTHKSLKIIRLGTSGSLQHDIPVDSLLVSEWGVGIDALNDFYAFTEGENAFCLAIQNALNLRTMPYLAAADFDLFQHFIASNATEVLDGLTLTLPGFYAPQGRTLRYKSRSENLLSQLHQFQKDGIRIANLEMETAGYYFFGKLLGHQMLSLNAILANRLTHEFSKQPEQQVDRLIRWALEKVLSLG
jgi:uridine phosphorylase